MLLQLTALLNLRLKISVSCYATSCEKISLVLLYVTYVLCACNVRQIVRVSTVFLSVRLRVLMTKRHSIAVKVYLTVHTKK